MHDYVSVTIAGSKLRVPKGRTILDAAVEYAICIPHLCHVPGLTAFGGCRLCIVELVENGRSKVTTSCTLDAKEGMVVRADTPKLRRLRKNVAELLVAEAPNSRAVQDMAVRCGVKDVRYPFRHNNCVLCGRCVRTCGELWQAKALGFVGRGKDRHVELPLGVRPEFCKRCYDCTTVCPMTITPCEGPMKRGEERLCGRCESQLTMNEDYTDTCMMCGLGEGFQCNRHATVW